MILTEELILAKMPDLVKKYNEYASQLKIKPVKKFSTKKNGIDRVIKLSQKITLKNKPTRIKVVKDSLPKVTKTRSIKSATIGYILDNEEDKDIVQKINKEFPNSKFNFAHISWYRSTLFKDNLIGPEHAPRRTKAYKQWKLNNN